MLTRIFITAWLSVLLVGMQQQMFVHEIDHLRAKVQRGHDVAVQNAADATCVECALLAGGSNAVPVAIGETTVAAAIAAPDVQRSELPPAARSPAYYHSRAPPPYA